MKLFLKIFCWKNKIKRELRISYQDWEDLCLGLDKESWSWNSKYIKFIEKKLNGHSQYFWTETQLLCGSSSKEMFRCSTRSHIHWARPMPEILFHGWHIVHYFLEPNQNEICKIWNPRFSTWHWFLWHLMDFRWENPRIKIRLENLWNIFFFILIFLDSFSLILVFTAHCEIKNK